MEPSYHAGFLAGVRYLRGEAAWQRRTCDTATLVFPCLQFRSVLDGLPQPGAASNGENGSNSCSGGYGQRENQISWNHGLPVNFASGCRMPTRSEQRRVICH